MESIEKQVKQQFAKVFQPCDWRTFKGMADFYLRQAAFLRKCDVLAPPKLRLLARNSQKRLFIGVGCELLLKAIYLKNGYGINKPLRNGRRSCSPSKLSTATSHLDAAETFSLDCLISQIRKAIALGNRDAVLKGLKIAKVFRNKEGHVVTAKHDFHASNYRDIEAALRELYHIGFGESLTVHFSIEPNEQPLWKISNA